MGYNLFCLNISTLRASKYRCSAYPNSTAGLQEEETAPCCLLALGFEKKMPKRGTVNIPSIWWNSARCVRSTASLRNTRSIEKYLFGVNSPCKWTNLEPLATYATTWAASNTRIRTLKTAVVFAQCLPIWNSPNDHHQNFWCLTIADDLFSDPKAKPRIATEWNGSTIG